MNNYNILEYIEETLPQDCELLIRTNHNSNGLSMVSREGGKWFVHLTRYTPYKGTESIYKKYGNDLFKILTEAAEYADRVL